MILNSHFRKEKKKEIQKAVASCLKVSASSQNEISLLTLLLYIIYQSRQLHVKQLVVRHQIKIATPTHEKLYA